ncbi:MAG: hypothetical protein KDA52_12805 [Planctomycetaceae bacterium]|nr:hypothetical protein [Planctomycetaceae bacterium]
MLKKLNSLAQQTATNVSRRQFLGRLGKGSAVAVMAAGGLLAASGAAQAGRGGNKKSACGEGYACYPPLGQRGCRFVGGFSGDGPDCTWNCKGQVFHNDCQPTG